MNHILPKVVFGRFVDPIVVFFWYMFPSIWAVYNTMTVLYAALTGYLWYQHGILQLIVTWVKTDQFGDVTQGNKVWHTLTAIFSD